MTTWFRLLDEDDKSSALATSIALLQSDAPDRRTFFASPDAFATIPGHPFPYWASRNLLEVFRRLPPLENAGRNARKGMSTLDDFRFVRLAWETRDDRSWRLFAKGGAFGRFYADLYLRTRWSEDGREVKAFVEQKVGSASRTIQATSFYSRPGATWPKRTQSGLSLRVLPSGAIFADKGQSVFVEGDRSADILVLLALMNSLPFRALVELQMAFGAYEVGVIQRTPVPGLTDAKAANLASLARRAWSLKRALDTTSETSHAFVLPAGLNEKATGLDRAAVESELDLLQRQMDEATFALYSIGSEERAAIEASSKRVDASDDASDEAGDDSIDEVPASAASVGAISWLFGVVFGRFDPRLATGERAIPPEPEPFDPLPARSPGMYPEGEEPADRPDILVDDEGHADDLAARALAVAERVKVDPLENLRAWLANEFFSLHIKMYSKSRRKAPIYWQLATPSASYSVWLYIHAFSTDTLFRVQNDYVAPKLVHEERRLETITREMRDGANAIQRKQLAAQTSLVEELRTFLDEVKRVAPLWKPDLDDGVIINFAPLWRLVPHDKAWQKELKATWDALCDHKYDWAHLAMHLWPEHVVPKCAQDRSLAIAHGLEDVFWVEGPDGKWTARTTPTKTVDELVKERTSPAVKSALKSLQEVSGTSGKITGRNGGGRRKAAASGGS